MTEVIHAWFSQKQFNNINNLSYSSHSGKAKRPYIYYRDQEGKIIQITEVSYTSNQYLSRFDDAVYLGVVTNFYKSSETPIKIEQ